MNAPTQLTQQFLEKNRAQTRRLVALHYQRSFLLRFCRQHPFVARASSVLFIVSLLLYRAVLRSDILAPLTENARTFFSRLTW